MLGGGIAGRLPAIDPMTGLTGTTVGSRGQLIVVQVLMAIETRCVCRSQLDPGAPVFVRRSSTQVSEVALVATEIQMPPS